MDGGDRGVVTDKLEESGLEQLVRWLVIQFGSSVIVLCLVPPSSRGIELPGWPGLPVRGASVPA